MQQVLHLFFLNHRKSLSYPENRVNIAARPFDRHQMEKMADQYISNRYRNKQSMSLQLQRKPQQKQKYQEENTSPQQRNFRVSMQDKMVMNKYIGAGKSATKQFSLPKINQRNSERQDLMKDDNSSRTQTPQQQQQSSASRNERRLKRRAEQITALSTNLQNIIDKVVNKYYAQIMKQPLLKFGQILKRKITDKNYKATDDVVNNLIDITQCLRTSSLRKDMLKFLSLVTLENNPLPEDFFCQFQLLRLNFDPKLFRLIDMSETQIKMVVGIFLGIKIICNNIFYHPWNVKMLELPIQLDKRVKPVIWAYASYFYTAITNMFSELPVHDPKIIQKLKRKGAQPMGIHKQNDEFYDRLALEYKSENRRIKHNIQIWIHRISQKVIMNRYKVIDQY